MYLLLYEHTDPATTNLSLRASYVNSIETIQIIYLIVLCFEYVAKV